MVVGRSRSLRLTVAGLAAWLATVAAALLTSLQLWLSGTSRLEIVLPAMLGVHVLIGIGEGLITVAALAFIERTRPDLVSAEQTAAGGGRGWVFGGLLVSLAVVLLSPLASADPDGLERVATDLGFLGRAQGAPFEILPNYSLPLLGDTPASTILAGLIGALLLAGLVWALGRGLRTRGGER